MMPAATDPLDGLNKPLDAFDVTYYQQASDRRIVFRIHDLVTD